MKTPRTHFREREQPIRGDSGLEYQVERLHQDNTARAIQEDRLYEPSDDHLAQRSMADKGIASYASADMDALQQAFEQYEQPMVESYFARKGKRLIPVRKGCRRLQRQEALAGLDVQGYACPDGQTQLYGTIRQGEDFEEKVAQAAQNYLGNNTAESRGAMKLYTILHENFHRAQYRSQPVKECAEGYSAQQSAEMANERDLRAYALMRARESQPGSQQHAMYSAVARIATQRTREVASLYN